MGGVIAVIRATGAIDALIASAMRYLGGRQAMLIAGIMTLFALGSSTIGMAEEYLLRYVRLLRQGPTGS